MINSTAWTAAESTSRQKAYRRFGLHNIRLWFRRWRRSRPFWGGFFSILSGLILLLGPTMAIRILFISGLSVIEAMLPGLLIAIFGLFLWFAPSQRHIVGILIEILAVLSLLTSNIGGFVIGMLFGMIGGALGFAWVPTEPRIKKWRTRRLLHLPLPAVQPDLELRGITTESSADLVGRAYKTTALADATESTDAGDATPSKS